MISKYKPNIQKKFTNSETIRDFRKNLRIWKVFVNSTYVHEFEKHSLIWIIFINLKSLWKKLWIKNMQIWMTLTNFKEICEIQKILDLGNFLQKSKKVCEFEKWKIKGIKVKMQKKCWWNKVIEETVGKKEWQLTEKTTRKKTRPVSFPKPVEKFTNPAREERFIAHSLWWAGPCQWSCGRSQW